MDDEARELTVDVVTCELMLETARACRDLRKALETVDIETVSSDRMEIAQRRMMRITLFARLVPSILDPRRIVCLFKRAAENPDWANSNYIHYFCPELTHTEIGEILGLKRTAVGDYIRAVEISAECYENLPEIK